MPDFVTGAVTFYIYQENRFPSAFDVAVDRFLFITMDREERKTASALGDDDVL